MQLTFNKFRQVVDHSSERVFNKLAEAVATSDNAALVAMFDDKLILLDEEKNQLHLADYAYENGVLSMHNFQQIELTQNDTAYLDEVIDRYFDLDDESSIAVEDLMTGFNLKYRGESSSIFTEAKDRKYRKIMENSRIGAIKKARQARDHFAADIKGLMEEPFMQNLTLKVQNSKDSIPAALNKVAFKNPYPIQVNTDIGGPAKELLKIRDNTNAMDAMKGVALKISEKWKSDSFRKKFDDMVNQIMKTESIELAKTAILSFLDENKELFLLKEDLFHELITKTTLMLGESDTESVVKIFDNIMGSKRGRMMKREYFQKHKIDEARLQQINTLTEEDAAAAGDADAIPSGDEPSKKAGNDLQEDDVDKIISIFKKIQAQMKDDSDEKDYVNGLVSALQDAKTTGITDSKMRDIIDFLNDAGSTKKDDKDDAADDKDADTDDSKKASDKEVSL